MVEFQPWVGGPSSAVTMNVRASCLKPDPLGPGPGSVLPGGVGNAESSPAGPAAGADAAGTGPAADGGGKAAAATGTVLDIREEASDGTTVGVLTRKAVREVERRSSMDATDATVRSEAVGGEAGAGGEIDVGDETEVAEEAEAGAEEGERGGDAEKGVCVEEDTEEGVVEEEQEVVEEEKEEVEEKQAAVEEGQEVGGGGEMARERSVSADATAESLDMAAMVEAGKSLDDPTDPLMIPVGTRVILKEAYSSKPRGGSINGAALVGKTVSFAPIKAMHGAILQSFSRRKREIQKKAEGMKRCLTQ